MRRLSDLLVPINLFLLLFVSSRTTWAFLLHFDQKQRKFWIRQTRNDCDNDIASVKRRRLLAKCAPALTSVIIVNPSHSEMPTEDKSFLFVNKNDSWIIPLKWIPSLNAYVLYFSLFGERFGAIVDTGSPFLTVPSYCDARRWGCFRPELTESSGLSDTIEIFANNQGPVVWRKADFSFSKSSNTTTPVVFGVLGEELMDGPGGVNFGLIKNAAPRIRPSILGQLRNIKAFQICLKSNSKDSNAETTAINQRGLNSQSFLTLFTKSIIVGNNYIPLVTDLNRRYRDPVQHYAAVCKSIRIDGRLLEPKKFHRTYVIFDTGVTGMVVSQTLFDERYVAARQNKEKRLWGGPVEISFETNSPGEVITLEAIKPVTTPLSQTPWGAGFQANLIVMGLAFLEGHTMTVDIDDQKLQIS